MKELLNKGGVLAAALLLVGHSYGQSRTNRASVEWGPELSTAKEGAFLGVVGSTDDHVYMTVAVKRDLFLRKMDTRYRTVYQKSLALKDGKDTHELEHIEVLDDRIVVFTSLLNKSAKTYGLYYQVYGESNLAPMGRRVRLAEMDIERKRNTGGFEVLVSPDRSKVLVHQHLPNVKVGRERFRLKVFDADMNPLWDRELDLPYEDSEFAVERLSVDNEGAVMLIGRKYAEKRTAKELRKDGLSTFTYHVITYRNNGSEGVDHPIEVKDKFIQDLQLQVGHDNDIICGGFYGLRSGVISGAFFMRLERGTMRVVHSSFKEFDRDFITSFMTEKEEKRATRQAERKDQELEMPSFQLREIVRRDDGGSVLVGEQYKYFAVTTCTTTGNGGRTCTTTHHYHYDDIIVVNIDPSGNIQWAAKVPKRQQTVNDGGRFSSYAMVVKQSEIHLLFNDNGKNLMLAPGDKVEMFKYDKNMLVTLVTINQDGAVKREALFPQDKREVIIRPKHAVQLSDDNLFIYAEWKKMHRFGKLLFK